MNTENVNTEATAENVTEFPKQEVQQPVITGTDVAKLFGKAAAMIGGGAVIGAILRGQDLSGLKGLGKACAGIGIIGLSHAAGSAAGDAIERDINNLSFAAKLFFGGDE